jgi:hypothetical protein
VVLIPALYLMRRLDGSKARKRRDYRMRSAHPSLCVEIPFDTPLVAPADLQEDVKIGQGAVGSYEKAPPESNPHGYNSIGTRYVDYAFAFGAPIDAAAKPAPVSVAMPRGCRRVRPL